MKSKLLLIVFSSVIISSCIKDFTGTITDKEEIEITSDNYLYEGDLYREYLTVEIQNNNTIIEALEKLSLARQLNEIEKEELNNAKDNILSLKDDFDNIIDIVGLRIPKPKPPCPNPTNCDYFNFQNLFISGNAEMINIEAYNTSDKLVPIEIGEFSPYPDLGIPVQVSSFKIESYKQTGLLIKVHVINEDGTERSYFVEGR
ncbi:hypothetical protein [Maribacter sp. 1_2014MBL_MicDiv]|uniref:hypothetical protein n=1 Tax=Maribacter sp. 1_2014MBL_MicDiv TaxID=1644130 RepID=UPI0008F4EA45|nr:hypothetical protein [Maribacter sp. 1_2014MBL_MicDiv]APA64572.1 hypothetical protein YQ22_09710 [Maribacter sp. 1_2014MBL_MicDiv]